MRRRHDPVAVDESSNARVLSASGHPETAQVRESARIAFHFVTHRIFIIVHVGVRQGQGLSGVKADERRGRIATAKV